MKLQSISLAALLAASSLAFTGCSDNYDYGLEGEGRLTISATLNSDVKVVSRASAEELRDAYGASLEMWITRVGDGPVRRYVGIDNLPTAAIALPSGQYAAEAWAGDSVSASWDKKYFKAHQLFDIVKGNSTSLNVTLTIANVLASVKYDDNVDEVLKDYTMEIGHAKGSLVFEGRDSRKGYYMMPQADRETLTVTLTGKDLKGKAYTQTETITGVKPGYEYIVHVKHDATIDPIAGSYFDISVDETEVPVEDNITITLAPIIKGVGLNLDDKIVGEEGKIGRVSVYVSAAEELQSLVMASEALNAAVGFPDIDLVTARQTYIDQLAAKGVTIARVEDSNGVLTNMRINLEPEFTNALGKGVHVFSFTATDNGRSSQATLTIDVSDAPVVTLAVDPASIDYRTATLRASVLQSPMAAASRAGEKLGFNYRRKGETAWTFIDGAVEGNVMTATLTGLLGSSTYEYAAVYGSFVGTALTFDTRRYPVIPNGDFEVWSTDSDKAIIPAASAADLFWDSGNHGSITMNKNVTTSATDVKHGGRYSAKLESQFVGIGAIGAFAAGNIFVGKFLGTSGTNGILGWGRPFDNSITPKALKGYVRYTPGTVDKASSKQSFIKSGDMDQGIIYVGLVTDDMADYNGSLWPCIVKTETAEVFNPEGSNVVWYGEKVFTAATDGMVEFTIDLRGVNTSRTWSHLIIVASASRYGDYFSGSTKSVMYIDDFEFVYD